MQNEKFDFKKFLCSSGGRIGLIVAFYAVFLGLVVLLVSMFGGGIPFLILAAAFVYFGWRALAKITPNIFLIMPIGGWAIYFLIKGMLALAIGPFIAPYQLAKKTADAVQKSVKEAAEDEKAGM